MPLYRAIKCIYILAILLLYMSTTIALSNKTKELLDMVRGEKSYNIIVYEMASERIRQTSQPR